MNRMQRRLVFGTIVLEAIARKTGAIIAWMVMPLTAVTCYEVFARYVLGTPTVWSFEVGYMLTGTYFLLGAGYALREEAHIRIDVIYSHLGTRARAVADLVGFGFVMLPTLTLFCPALWDYMAQAYRSGERSALSDWNPIVWPFRLVFFLGFFLLLLQTVAQVLKSLSTLIMSERVKG